MEKEAFKKSDEVGILDKKDKMTKKENRTVWGVVGLILTIFGFLGTITIIVNREYLFGLPVTAISVIAGIILMAWAFSD